MVTQRMLDIFSYYEKIVWNIPSPSNFKNGPRKPIQFSFPLSSQLLYARFMEPTVKILQTKMIAGTVLDIFSYYEKLV